MQNQKFHTLIRSAAIVSIIVGFLVIIGWIFNIQLFKTVIANYPAMKFNTAICFVLAGLSLLFITKESSSANIIYKILALLIFLFGLISFSENIFEFNSGLDNLFFSNAEISIPGEARMASATSGSFMILGFSFFFLKATPERIRIFAQSGLHTVSAIATAIVIGYLFNVPAFYKLFFLQSVALHTGIIFLVLTIGASFVNSNLGITGLFLGKEIGNQMAREIYPYLIILILGSGFLRLQYFRSHPNAIEFGIALVTTSFLLISLLIIALSGKQLNKINRKRLEAEKSLRFLDLAPDAIVVVNKAGSIIFSNIQTEKTFGYTAKELLGCQIELLIPNKFNELHEEYRKNYFSSPTIRTIEKEWELFGKTKTGVQIPIEISLSPIETSEGLVMAASIRDITERKKAEQKLKESEEKFYKSFHSSPAGITLTYLADGNCIDANESFLKLTGYSKQEVIGHSATELGMLDPLTREKIIEELKNSGGIKSHEILFKNKSGELVTALFSIEPITLNNETCIITTFYDITERKKAEERLANEEKQKKEEIMDAIINAQEKERYEISHELHDNVSQVLTTCKLLMESAVKENDHKFIQLSSDHLQLALDEIRNLSHQLNPDTIKYIGLEGSINDLIDAVNKTKKVKLNFHFSVDQIENVKSDIQLALFRIIQEQINNILKHSDATHAVIDLSEKDKRIILVISDDGKGHDFAFQKHGLGLRNIFNRAEFHKGKAEIFSQPNMGFELHVSIPLEK